MGSDAQLLGRSGVALATCQGLSGTSSHEPKRDVHTPSMLHRNIGTFSRPVST